MNVMDEIFKQAAVQLPATVLVIVVVMMFLKFIERFMSRQEAFLKNLHDEHIAARELSRDALTENSETMRELISSVRGK